MCENWRSEIANDRDPEMMVIPPELKRRPEFIMLTDQEDEKVLCKVDAIICVDRECEVEGYLNLSWVYLEEGKIKLLVKEKPEEIYKMIEGF